MGLNEKLRSLREKCGLTQEQVAKTLNIDRSSYTYYETGKTEPSISSLIKLSNLFKVSVEELLGSETPNAVLVRDGRSGRKPPSRPPQNQSHIYDLDKQEKQLLCYYRSMEEDKKKQAMAFLESLIQENGETPADK
ncbi:MAG: helix-turn-helix domain-containing protein [Oscillospiraceae bacterium]|nr:helix-turn-helix domain-containing protein [Oscillospiraceae bacterium]